MKGRARWRLRLDLPGPFPRLERPLSLQQRVLKSLQLDDLSDLLVERQGLAFATERVLASALPGDQLWRRAGTDPGGGRAVRARGHAS